MMPDIEDFARRTTATRSSRDPHRAAANFSEHGWLSVNGGPRATGHAAIAEVAQGFMTTVPDLEVGLEGLAQAPAALQCHWRLRGTASGGHKVDITGVEAWQMARDGRIAATRGRFDAAEYARQLGEA